MSKTSSDEVRAFFQQFIDYLQRRVDNGDILLDQWMPDTWEACDRAIAAVDLIEENFTFTPTPVHPSYVSKDMR